MGDDSDTLGAAQSPTQPETAEDTLTLQEAATELGVAVAVLHFAVLANRLTCSHHYGRNRVTRSEMESYRLRTQPNPAPVPVPVPVPPPSD